MKNSYPLQARSDNGHAARECWMSKVREEYHNNVRSDVFDIVPKPAGRVLDLGGGIGATGAALKTTHDATHVVLVDLVADEASDGVDQAISGNLEDPSFIQNVLHQHGPFDTVLCLDVLEHLRDPWMVIRELHSGLSTNGVIIASIPNVNHHQLLFPLLFRGDFELKDTGLLDRTHIRWFTEQSAIEMMTGTGLKLETVSGVIGRKNRLLSILTFGLSNRFTILQYRIRVRRSD